MRVSAFTFKAFIYFSASAVRRIIAASLTVALGLGLLGAQPAAAVTGCDIYFDGTTIATTAQLQAAMDAVSDYSPGSCSYAGDTVTVTFQANMTMNESPSAVPLVSLTWSSPANLVITGDFARRTINANGTKFLFVNNHPDAARNSVTINNLRITNAVASVNTVGGLRGGAIQAVNSNLTISNSQIDNNRSASAGGAVWSSGQLTVSDSYLYNNDADGDEFNNGGGAVFFAGPGPLSISSTHFQSNTATAYGGAVHVARSSAATITSSRFESNAAHCGSAIQVDKTALISGITVIENSILPLGCRNLAGNAVGAAINGWDVRINNSYLARNYYGAAVFAQNNLISIYNTFGETTNTSLADVGEQVGMGDNSSFTVKNTIFAGANRQCWWPRNYTVNVTSASSLSRDDSCALTSSSSKQNLNAGDLFLSAETTSGLQTYRSPAATGLPVLAANGTNPDLALTTDQNGTARANPYTIGSIQVGGAAGTVTIQYDMTSPAVCSTLPTDTNRYPLNGTFVVRGNSGPAAQYGKIFQGWTIGGSSTIYKPGDHVQLSQVANYISANNLRLVASFKSVTTNANGDGNFTLRYYTTGGNYVPPTNCVAIDTQEYAPGDSFIPLAPTPGFIPVGKELAGWSRTSGATSPDYIVGVPALFPSRLDSPQLALGSTYRGLYPVWVTAGSVTTYSVTYDGNGNDTGTPPTAAAYAYGATVGIKSTSMTKAGHVLVGWNREPLGTGTAYGKYGSSNSKFTMPEENITLYAQWSEYRSVFYHDSSATSGRVGSDSSANEVGSWQLPVAPTADFAQRGMEFVGWNDRSDFTGNFYSKTAGYVVPSGNLHLYAVWQQPLSFTELVNYHGNGHDSGSVPVDNGRYIAGAHFLAKEIGTMSKGNYTFVDWCETDTGGGACYLELEVVQMPTIEYDLYAEWVPNTTYTLTYDGNGADGGTVPVDSNRYAQGRSVWSKLNTGGLYKDHAKFGGWTLDQSVTIPRIRAGANFTMPVKDAVLYAIWDDAYGVTYDANGGTGSVPVDSNFYVPGEYFALGSGAGLSYVGYRFIGWSLTPVGPTLPIGTMGGEDQVLFAQWLPTGEFKVTYDGNAADFGTVPIDNTVYRNSDPVNVLGNTGNLVKDGYTFDGWNTLDTGLGTPRAVGSSFNMPNHDLTLYAVWTPLPTYSVTYYGNNADSGDVPVDSGNYQESADVTVLENTGNLVREGYTFEGWNTLPSGLGIDRQPGSVFAMGSADVDLYAVWVATARYTVTYDGNGNTVGTAPVDNGSYWEGKEVTALGNTGGLAIDTRIFICWMDDALGTDCTYFPGEKFAMPARNLTLYAMYAPPPPYYVTYDGNNNDGGSVPVDSTVYYYADDVVVLGNTGSLTRTHFAFAGWSLSSAGDEPIYSAGDSLVMPRRNLTFYAVWAALPTYTVTYSAPTADFGNVPVDGTAYYTGDQVTVLGNTGALVKVGFSFGGWNTQSDGLGTPRAAASQFNMGDANVILYAVWVPLPTYTVTYSAPTADFGNVPVDGTAYYTGDQVTVRGNTGGLVKAGFTFGGWNTQSDGLGTPRAAASQFSMGNANVILYAVWIPVPTTLYTVTYFPNGADGGVVPVDVNTYLPGDTVTVLGNIGLLTKTGSTFLGWTMDQAGNGTLYVAGSRFIINANTSLYAKWSVNGTGGGGCGGCATVEGTGTTKYSSSIGTSSWSFKFDSSISDGVLNWTISKKLKFTATLSSCSFANGVYTLSGRGNLYYWKSSAWVLSASNVAFTIKARLTTTKPKFAGAFGIDFKGHVLPKTQGVLPPNTLLNLASGSVKIS